MHRHRLICPMLAFAATLWAACEERGGDHVLAIDATGFILAAAYLDRDGNAAPDATDGPVGDLELTFVAAGTRDTVGTATTDGTGAALLAGIPVGQYRALVDATAVGDTIQVARVDPAEFTLAVDDTALVLVQLGYPLVNTSEARSYTQGRRVVLSGTALNDWIAFGDSTVHVADAVGALRIVRAAPTTAVAGDSIRIRGTVATRDGQPVLSDAAVFVFAGGPAPSADSLGTAAAASADAGARDAALVRIAGASVLAVAPNPGGDAILTVDDGSGRLDVVLDRHGGFGAAPPAGALVDAVGVLVPVPGQSGRWWLKPRSAADLTVSYAVVTVADARAESPGKLVEIRATALNGWATFGDSTVHVADATGTLRTIRVGQTSLFAGDSVRLVGTTAVRDGQPVLTDVVASVLGTGTLPVVRQVETADAAVAASGLDAALIRVVGAAVVDTATTAAGDFLLTVDDGLGHLRVLLDKDTGIPPGPFVPGVDVDATGLLVPEAGGGTWLLKPRSPSDIAVQ